MEQDEQFKDLYSILDIPSCSPIPTHFFDDQLSPINSQNTKKAGDVRDISGRHVYSIYRKNSVQSNQKPYDAIMLE